MAKNELAGGTVHKMPPDLKKALLETPAARAVWEDITPLARNEWICWVISVKKPETRRRHIERVAEELLEGVDDAVQESLLVISRKVKGLKAAAAFSSWLFTVIKRECRKLERMMFSTEELDEDKVEQQLVCRADNDLRIDLASALESLPAHYLEVVLLRDFEELTIAEIAERLEENPAAIKSRLHRARELACPKRLLRVDLHQLHEADDVGEGRA